MTPEVDPYHPEAVSEGAELMLPYAVVESKGVEESHGGAIAFRVEEQVNAIRSNPHGENLGPLCCTRRTFDAGVPAAESPRPDLSRPRIRTRL
jgi:hypothetical protein